MIVDYQADQMLFSRVLKSRSSAMGTFGMVITGLSERKSSFAE
jgi:hypothetical protein